MCAGSGDLVRVSPSVRPRPPQHSDRCPLGSPEWRNARGRELEVEGKVDDAVELYELNVRDGFLGPLPYDRLRVIYFRRNELASAIRVCQAAIKAMETQPTLTQHFEKAMKRLLI